MDRSVVQFEFNENIPMPEVNASLKLAICAVESLFGEDRMRLEAPARMNMTRRICLVDVTTEVGKTLATIFGGYVRREFGYEGISVRFPTMAGVGGGV